MLLWPPQANTQLSPVAARSWFFQAATIRATATTGGLNQVRVSGVVCVFTTGTSAPFHMLFPLSRPPCPPSALLRLLFPLLSPFFPTLSLLAFNLTSSLLPCSSQFPPPPRSKLSYGEGNIKICRSLTNPNRDPWWSSAATWD
ncbi:unnamed protein product [Schistocephalus solidus]|uniref:Uncharacterized protein n=1 Tax=Schistocephalus solidus TaxID=70667 RepID=A0A183T340_SCHSO|nr:unnamed protein product [Schistocephalus solidus]